MPIENRNLEAGTRLVANYKKQAYVCTVEEEEGKLVFVLKDGKRFKSPSSAASAVIGGAANGWRFWSVEGDAKPAPTATPTKAARSRTKADSATSKTKAERKPRARKTEDTSLIRLDKHQEELGEGEARWWCNGCMASFVVFGGETPVQCPNGHRADDPELTAPAGTPAEAASE